MNKEFDTTFYSEFRYEGTPEQTISAFCSSAKKLLQRFIADLRSENKGSFGSESNSLAEQLAVGVEQIISHVDVFQDLSSGQGFPPETGRIIKNVVANVLADANAANVALARVDAPKANEAKFDQGKTGSSVELMKDYANKIKDAGEGIAKILGNGVMEGIFDIVAAILEDIALFGTKAAADTGGNEATRQIEAKLDYVIPELGGIKTTQDGLKAAQKDATDFIKRINADAIYIRSEVDSIEYKAERLGNLLGRTLVGTPWDVTKQLKPHTTGGEVPAISIKDEMHGMEKKISTIINQLNVQVVVINKILNFLNIIIKFFINIFPNFFLYFKQFLKEEDIKPAPPGSKPLIDERLKKIYVYAEDKFAPQSKIERKTIEVKTAAFDLSGWIDLSDIRKGDEIEITTFLKIAGKRRRLDRQRFDQPALLSFSDFARGLQYISGNDVRIQLRQPTSADNFKTKIDIGYQFVVESQ